jgi:hypothetical protein
MRGPEKGVKREYHVPQFEVSDGIAVDLSSYK